VLAASRPSIPAGAVDDRAFNLGTGVETSVTDLAQGLIAVSGRAVPMQHAPARPGEQQRSVVSIDKARAGLGWAPAVSLADGLRHTFDWFASR